MNPRLLAYLKCPECGAEFYVKEFEAEKAADGSNAVRQGMLVCSGCAVQFPVIDGVPRILRRETMVKLVAGYADFTRKYGINTGPLEPVKPAAGADRSLKVAKMYEYGWSIYSKVTDEYRNEFLHVLDGHVKPEDFRDKTVLDAGCGMGRFAYFVREFSAKEIVGFDLSEAVVTAQNFTHKDAPNAYFFQGDIFYLPLKPSFDVIYCIGVIHHLPDPAKGVRILTELLKPSGTFFAWVYGHSGIKYPLNAARAVTLRLPIKFVRALSAVPAFFLYLINAAYRVMNKIPFLKRLAEFVPFHQYSDRSLYGIRWIAQDHLSVPIINYFKETDIRSMLKDTPLKNVAITSRYPGKSGRSWRFSGQRV